MKTIIKSVTVGWGDKCRTYTVGRKYSGEVLDSITDTTSIYNEREFIRYLGLSAEQEVIFTLINCSVEARFKPGTSKEEPWGLSQARSQERRYCKTIIRHLLNEYREENVTGLPKNTPYENALNAAFKALDEAPLSGEYTE